MCQCQILTIWLFLGVSDHCLVRLVPVDIGRFQLGISVCNHHIGVTAALSVSLAQSHVAIRQPTLNVVESQETLDDLLHCKWINKHQEGKLGSEVVPDATHHVSIVKSTGVVSFVPVKAVKVDCVRADDWLHTSIVLRVVKSAVNACTTSVEA